MSIEFLAQPIADITRAQSTGPVSPIGKGTGPSVVTGKAKSVEPSPIDEFIGLEQKVSDADLNELNHELTAHDIALQFSRDEETGTIVMKLVNSQTGESLRQIPNEVTLKLAATLGKLQGGLFDRRA
jgi:flagellar protein FlaG